MEHLKSHAGMFVDMVLITSMLMQLFVHWKLTSSEILSSLGLSENSRSIISKYRKGKSISSNRDSMDRAKILLDIHKNLKLLFPENKELAYSWMKTRNRAFDGRTPIEIVAEMGYPGLLYVRSYLDSASGG